MKQYHKNPRDLSERQYKDLGKWMRELGDLSGVVHDLNSDEIINGNQRSRVMDINDCELEVIKEWDQPDEVGTVTLGYVIWAGRRFNYRAVRWTERQCEKANIIANKAGGTWGFDALANNFEVDDLLDWGFTAWELDVVPDFQPVDESEQPRLDQKKPVICPECGNEFTT